MSQVSGCLWLGYRELFNDAPVDIGIKNNFSNPTKPSLGRPPDLASLRFGHKWNERFTSSAGYSLVTLTTRTATAVCLFIKAVTRLGICLFHPTPRVTMGGEFPVWAPCELSRWLNVNDYRIQVSFNTTGLKGFEY